MTHFAWFVCGLFLACKCVCVVSPRKSRVAHLNLSSGLTLNFPKCVFCHHGFLYWPGFVQISMRAKYKLSERCSTAVAQLCMTHRIFSPHTVDLQVMSHCINTVVVYVPPFFMSPGYTSIDDVISGNQSDDPAAAEPGAAAAGREPAAAARQVRRQRAQPVVHRPRKLILQRAGKRPGAVTSYVHVRVNYAFNCVSFQE